MKTTLKDLNVTTINYGLN